MIRLSAAAAGLVLCISCSSIEFADYAAIHKETGVRVSKDATPATNTEVGLVVAEECGFYLLGLIPLREVSVHEALRQLAIQAKKRGAIGVSRLEIIRQTPSLFSFSKYPFPWHSFVQARGQAYR